MILGYESLDEVVGERSSVLLPKPGARVAMDSGVPCCCNSCFHNCSGMILTATSPWDGIMTRFYVITPKLCYRVPYYMSIGEAAIVELISIAITVAKTAGLCAY